MKRIIRILVLATLINVVFVCYAFANTINIPADYSTIQAGIDAASNGDTVLVQPGTYVENINYNGKNITVASLFLTTQDTSYISQTIIDGDSLDSVVKFESGEDTTTVLSGFTITNGHAQGSYPNDNGGGIYCRYSSPSLDNITIVDNNADNSGGGIYSNHSSPSLDNVTITGNNADRYGGGVYCYYSSPNLEDVTISNNSADAAGGGIYCKNNSFLIFNTKNRCNIYSNNTVGSRGFGADFFTIQCDLMDVILDTFTVLPPTDYYVSPIDNFTFDILHSIQGNLLNSDVYVSIDGDNANSGTSQDEPFKTIKYALSRIYSDSMNVNTIHLGEGIFSDSTNGETFPLHWSNYVNLAGSGENETILDANNTSGVMQFDYVNDAIIEHITITNGNANKGGGIYCWNSSPFLQNLIIEYSNAYEDGGGIYCKHYSSPYLDNIIINGNDAGWGGGFFCSDHSSPILMNAIISNNNALWHGGGFYCYNNSSPVMENVAIKNNYSKYGGGIYSFDSTPLLHHVIITGNITDCFGGGISCGGNTSPFLENVTITGNSAYYGCGISCNNNSLLSIVNSIVSNNTGSYGIYVYSGGNPTIKYSDFWNNEGGNFYGVNDSIGVNVTTNANGDSCDVFYNIQLDPLFVDPLNGNYHLSWANFPTPDSTMSPCIDAGDPSSPPDPDGTIADMGAYYFNQNVSVDDPQEITTYQLINYPNPISINNNNLTVSFYLHKPGKVKIQLFNIKGQLVSTLINEEKNIGEHSISHSVNNLLSGIYFTKLSVDGVDREIKKVVLLR